MSVKEYTEEFYRINIRVGIGKVMMKKLSGK
jgi:hypothetical protein